MNKRQVAMILTTLMTQQSRGYTPMPLPGTSGNVLTSNGTKWTSAAASAAVMPPGVIVHYAGNTAPSTWVIGDGAAVARTGGTYDALFAVVGETYGAGDSTTTFNLPNCSGVFLRGAGSQTIGSITYTGTRGTTQADAFQGHFHNTDAPSGVYNGGNPGSGVFVGGGGAAPTGAAVTDGANGSPRASTETRPANISATCIVKL